MVVVMAAAGWVLILLIAFFLGVYFCRRKGKPGAMAVSFLKRLLHGAILGNVYEIFPNPVATDEEEKVGLIGLTTTI